MEFEVSAVVGGPPGRGRGAVVTVIVGLAAVAGIALANSGPAGIEATPAATSGTRPIAAAAPPDAAAHARTVPSDVNCRDVERRTCQRMARAAIRALPDDAPAVLAATVWRSLLCGDTFDCPPAYLDGSEPLGSVTVRFADGSPHAAINVVEGRSGPIQRPPRAWIVRWLPETGLSARVLAALRQEIP
jgi:hypothetical protein